MEEWKAIEGFPNYLVSSQGRIKSLFFNKEKILKQADNNSGYLFVGITDGTKRHLKTVHRLVADAFLPNPNFEKTVDHLNRNKKDNRLCNLAWKSYSNQNLNRELNIESNTGERCIYKTQYETFRVCIMRLGKLIHNKTYKTFEEAIEARDKFLISLDQSCTDK